MRTSRRLVGLALVLVLALTLFGVAAPATAQDPKVLVIGWEQEPELLSPRVDMTFGTLLTNFYGRGVWDWYGDYTIFPIMVEEIPTFDNGLVKTLENGNTQVTYTLKEGIKWSDGEPITADDLMFYHEMQMNPAAFTFQRGSYPDVVESVEKVDDRTVVLTYNQPYPDFQSSNILFGAWALPQHLFADMLAADGNIDNHPYFSGEGVVGYGPYVLSEWRVGEGMTFDRNEYWDGQAPAFDQVIVRFIEDTQQMVNAMRAGEIDIAFNFPDPQVADYESIEGVEVFGTPGVYGDAIWMNLRPDKTHPALLDVNVRKAIVHAIDRATLAEQLVGPGTELAKSWFSAKFLPEDFPFLEYDPDLAKQMLDEAGWVDSNENGTRDKDGMELILRWFTTNRQIRMDYQVAIQGYLDEVGVGTQLYPVPSGLLFADFLERGILDTGDFDMALFALSTDALSPAANAPDWFGCEGIPSAENPNGNNGWGFCDPRFDELDLLVLSTVDPEERLALAQEEYQHFFDGQFWHGLYLRPTWYAVAADRVTIPDKNLIGTYVANYFANVEFFTPAN
ncbi:MAG: peptide ABC transporter substrate-binding protein [Anaerolineae bacterium]|nr:peptide ABC transporter substrate-binding protein [Anaerolineae bacterium]